MRLRKFARLMLTRWTKDGDSTRASYEEAWSGTNAEFLQTLHRRRPDLPPAPHGGLHTGLDLLGDHLRLIDRHLGPLAQGRDRLRVLEVGSGRGLNLACLAAHHPTVEFFGAELSLAGARHTRGWSVIDDPQLRTLMGDDVEGVHDGRLRSAVDRPMVVQTNCQPLPFRDETFDFVYSRCAIEQMNDCWTETVREVWRVLRPGGQFVAIEPFRDFQTPRQYGHLWLHNYFRAPARAFTRLGFSLALVDANVLGPTKMGWGAVVAEKGGRCAPSVPRCRTRG
jgi:SAM-dependent methyltransferase